MNWISVCTNCGCVTRLSTPRVVVLPARSVMHFRQRWNTWYVSLVGVASWLNSASVKQSFSTWSKLAMQPASEHSHMFTDDGFPKLRGSNASTITSSALFAMVRLLGRSSETDRQRPSTVNTFLSTFETSFFVSSSFSIDCNSIVVSL